VSEEYNDNVFQDNANRQSDFITGFSPALTLFVNRPSYEISAGYTLTSEIYAEDSSLSKALSRQAFVGTAVFRLTPRLTLNVSELFLNDRNGNITAQGPTTGRQDSWSNTFSPGMSWQVTGRSGVSISASYSVLRFLGDGAGDDSDTYGFQSTYGYSFTPRLTGTLSYNFTYIDPQNEQSSITHNPAIGLVYRFTPTLIGVVSGGPAITTIQGGDTSITPAGSVSLTQTFAWGSASLQYTRAVGVAGGFGGTTDTQRASGILSVLALRGLLLVFSPVYTKSESVSSEQTGSVDVQTFTLNLSAMYQVARYVSVFAGYAFLHQRTGGSSSQQIDADQNRVRVGVQFGYPINFD